MVNFPGRNGRRRRVLNEEVLSASSSHTALRARSHDEVRDAHRYSDAAGVENHPQVTDFIPRQYRTIALLVLVGAAAASTLGAVHHFATPIASAIGMPTTGPFDLAAPGNIAAWVATVVLLMAGATCTLVYSIRRHRIDDFRGRYRIWLAAAAACVLLSLNSVADLHIVVSAALTHVTGWSALRGGAVWWLVLGGLPMVWIFVRTLLDAKECRLAASLLVAAAISYATTAAAYFGALSTLGLRLEIMLAGAAQILGHWMLLAAVVSYARFVILDAQGLIAVAPRVKRPRKTAAKKSGVSEQSATQTPSLLSAGGYSRQRPAHDLQPAKPAIPEQWVDGTRPERESYDDDDDDSPGDGRKLSKADRKRLRKLKVQNRAA